MRKFRQYCTSTHLVWQPAYALFAAQSLNWQGALLRMYQYGAGAGIGCDTSVLVPAATLSVGEAPSAPGKRRWAALQGFPVQFPRPPARTPVLGSAHAQRSQHSTDVDMMPIAVSAGETLDDKRDPPPDKIRTKLALQNKRGRAYGVSD
ncbi:hypothetical protein ACHAPE_001309 [Trichoderma viride]